MRKIIKNISYIVALASVFTIWSCEKERSSAVDPNYLPPFIVKAGLSLNGINLDSDTTGTVVILGNNNYRISISAQGLAVKNSAAATIRGVAKIFKPGATSSFSSVVLTIQENSADTISFSSTLTFTIQRSDVGLLRFEFSLSTSTGEISNIVQRTLLITRQNSKPRVTNVILPDSVTVGSLPSPDSTFLVSAVVSDSDGVDDIADARFISQKPDSSYANCGFPIPLFDDGSTAVVFPPNIKSGDALAGDGIFSVKVRLVSVSINRACPPPDTVYTKRGIYVFTFSAIDKSGAESDPFTQLIKVK